MTSENKYTAEFEQAFRERPVQQTLLESFLERHKDAIKNVIRNGEQKVFMGVIPGYRSLSEDEKIAFCKDLKLVHPKFVQVGIECNYGHYYTGIINFEPPAPSTPLTPTMKFMLTPADAADAANTIKYDANLGRALWARMPNASTLFAYGSQLSPGEIELLRGCLFQFDSRIRSVIIKPHGKSPEGNEFVYKVWLELVYPAEKTSEEKQ